MGRPKASPDQLGVAEVLHTKGYGPKGILSQLEQRFDEPVSLGTVNNWIKQFKKFEGDVFLDTPFQWENMDKAGIPWEEGEYLLKVWKWLQDEIGEGPPTFRHMRWWWRAHLACPNLDYGQTHRLVVAAESQEVGDGNEDILALTRALAEADSSDAQFLHRKHTVDHIMDARKLPSISTTTMQRIGRAIRLAEERK